jgi:hypothetical protein
MQNNIEKELEKSFIEHYAATMGSDDDMGSAGAGVSPDDMEAAGNILSEVANDGESAPAGEEAEQSDEEGLFDKKPDAGLEEAEAMKDVIPWAEFKIILDTRYMANLMKKYAGPEDDEDIQKKAEAQSYYIRCAKGNKRVEGIWNRTLIGGYGTKEKLGADLQWMKKMTVAEGEDPEKSPGFPKSEIKDLLKDMEEPVVVTEEVKEEIERAHPEKATETSETSEAVAKKPVEQAPAAKAAKPPIPEPVGDAGSSSGSLAAGLKDAQKRRILRAELIKNL